MPRLSRASTNSGAAAVAPLEPGHRLGRFLPFDQQHAQPVGGIGFAGVDVERPPVRLLGAAAIAQCATRVPEVRPVGRVVGIDLGGALKLGGRLARAIRVRRQQPESVVRRRARRRQRDRRLLGARRLLAKRVGGGARRALRCLTCRDREVVQHDRIRRPAARGGAVDDDGTIELSRLLQRARIRRLKQLRVRFAPGQRFERRQRAARVGVQRGQRILEGTPIGDPAWPDSPPSHRPRRTKPTKPRSRATAAAARPLARDGANPEHRQPRGWRRFASTWPSRCWAATKRGRGPPADRSAGRAPRWRRRREWSSSGHR
mgnify:CR=1 FL=1